jgi:hypothetical protein
MDGKKQIFQTVTQKRWKTFQWSSRLILFILILMIPIFFITLKRGLKPALPILANSSRVGHSLENPITPKDLSAKELRKFKGFDYFLRAKTKIEKLKNQPVSLNSASEIRAAFFVDWDPQSLFSLQKNIDKLNMVVPEWFFIDPKTDLLRTEIDTAALKAMKKGKVKILPLINNINQSLGEGEFDGDLIHRILHDTNKRERLINDIVKTIQKYDLQGINIDFEEFKQKLRAKYNI